MCDPAFHSIGYAVVFAIGQVIAIATAALVWPAFRRGLVAFWRTIGEEDGR